MIKTYVRPFLSAAFVFAFASGAFAAIHGQFDNMCTEGLAMGKKVQTDCSVNAKMDGKTYCFSNKAAEAQFMKDPSANLAKAKAYFASAESH